jgi:hypothetical protein
MNAGPHPPEVGVRAPFRPDAPLLDLVYLGDLPGSALEQVTRGKTSSPTHTPH